MKCPTVDELTREFRNLDTDDAELIVRLAAAVDSPDDLQALIEARCPDAARYVHSMYFTPYDSHMWRRTVVLHAINRALGTHGVESLGPVNMHKGPPYEFCNAGDMYAATLIYSRDDDDEITIGCAGDTQEAMENLEVPKAWGDHGRDEFMRAVTEMFNELDPDHDHDDDNFYHDKIDHLWREGCNELGIDEFIEESSGYYFPIDSWMRAVNRSSTFRSRLAAMAKEHRTPNE